MKRMVTCGAPVFVGQIRCKPRSDLMKRLVAGSVSSGFYNRVEINATVLANRQFPSGDCLFLFVCNNIFCMIKWLKECVFVFNRKESAMAEERRFFKIVLCMETNTISSTEIGHNFYGQEGAIEFENAFRISTVCSKTKRLAAERILKETALSYLRIRQIQAQPGDMQLQKCLKSMNQTTMQPPIEKMNFLKPTQSNNKRLKVFIGAVCHTSTSSKSAGGWVSIIQKSSGAESTIFGGAEKTTINRMELTGLVETLKRIEEPSNILLTSTSEYLIKTISNNWLDIWSERGWKRGDGTPLRNVDLWKEVHLLKASHIFNCVYVKSIEPDTELARCIKKAQEEAVYYGHPVKAAL